MRERPRSLRRLLLELLLAGTGLVWLAAAVATYVDARYHMAQIFDAQLEEYSEVLTALVGHEAAEMPADTVTSLEHELGITCTYQMFTTAGELLMRSHAAPVTPLSTTEGFSDAQNASGQWRVFRRTDPDSRIVIVVAHDTRQRERNLRGLGVRIVVPLLAGLPLLAVALWFAVRRALSPLGRIANDVAGRDAGRLDPVDTQGAPAEVQPLVEALNRLFARVAESFRNERRFTGDAAHELRTPLAALRAQAEVALTTTHEERRRNALGQVVAGVERATRVIEQMLAMARLDAMPGLAARPVDLARLCADVCGEVRATIAAGRRVELAVQAGGGRHEARGDATLLEALVRNLLENAVKHAPDGGRVALSLGGDDAGARIDVEDSGPGVAEDLRKRIFDRFYRAPGAAGPGSGLGLSIARRIVELHGGTIEAGASAALGGLRVTVRLPALRKDSLRRGEESGVVATP